MSKIVLRFARDESGVAVVEYGLMASLVVLAIINAVAAVGGDFSPVLTGISERFGLTAGA